MTVQVEVCIQSTLNTLHRHHKILSKPYFASICVKEFSNILTFRKILKTLVALISFMSIKTLLSVNIKTSRQLAVGLYPKFPNYRVRLHIKRESREVKDIREIPRRDMQHIQKFMVKIPLFVN